MNNIHNTKMFYNNQTKNKFMNKISINIEKY